MPGHDRNKNQCIICNITNNTLISVTLDAQGNMPLQFAENSQLSQGLMIDLSNSIPIPQGSIIENSTQSFTIPQPSNPTSENYQIWRFVSFCCLKSLKYFSLRKSNCHLYSISDGANVGLHKRNTSLASPMKPSGNFVCLYLLFSLELTYGLKHDFQGSFPNDLKYPHSYTYSIYLCHYCTFSNCVWSHVPVMLQASMPINFVNECTRFTLPQPAILCSVDA